MLFVPIHIIPMHAELRAGCNLERKSGRALPPRLTPKQKAVVEKLLEVHGDDFEVKPAQGTARVVPACHVSMHAAAGWGVNRLSTAAV